MNQTVVDVNGVMLITSMEKNAYKFEWDLKMIEDPSILTSPKNTQLSI